MIAEAFVLAVVAGMPSMRTMWYSLCERYPEYEMFVVGCFLSQLVGYFLGVAPYWLLDILRPAAFRRRKIQCDKYATRAQIIHAVGSLLTLFFLVMLPLIAVGGLAMRFVGISRDGPLPSTPKLLVHLSFFLVVEDYLNYWLHRMLHQPWLYSHIHSVHHEFNAPFAMAAAYAHPLEVIILAIPTFAGPLLLSPHMFTVFVWQLLRNYEAIDIHSGYETPFSAKTLFPAYAGPEHHDYHHYMHSGNFASIYTWCDQLYGTDLGFRTYKERKEKAV